MADRPLSVQRQPVIIITGAGATTLISGATGYCIYIIGLILTADAVEQATLQDEHTSFADIHFAAGGNVLMPACEPGWIRCQSGDDFVISLSNGANVGGMLLYRMIPDHVEL